MDIQYKFDDQVTSEELFDLMERMETATNDRFPAKNVFHYSLRDTAKENKAIENSISVTARTEEGLLVGFIRIITDHVYMFYFLDLMVDPAMRCHGIGTKLMTLSTDRCKENGFIKIFFTAIPDKVEFYANMGFKPSMSPVMGLRGEDYVETQE
jgi:N-acetylglutamate synthase-like GNAT family acetyltransferase